MAKKKRTLKVIPEGYYTNWNSDRTQRNVVHTDGSLLCVVFADYGEDEAIARANKIADTMNAQAKVATAAAELQDPGDGPDDAWYIASARDEYQTDGEIEIDDNAVVSRGSDPGAYVAAWVWVYSDTDDDD